MDTFEKYRRSTDYLAAFARDMVNNRHSSVRGRDYYLEYTPDVYAPEHALHHAVIEQSARIGLMSRLTIEVMPPESIGSILRQLFFRLEEAAKETVKHGD